MNEETYNRGIETIRKIFGDDFASRASDNTSDFAGDIVDMIVRYCFGETWNRPELDYKTRSMLTISMLIALGRDNEIKLHARGAINNGVSKDELAGIVIHSMIYCGVPQAVNAMRAIEDALSRPDNN